MIPLNNLDKNRVIPVMDLSGVSFIVPSMEESRESIYAIDFTMLIHKLCLPDPNISRLWTDETANEAILLYKNWLWLIRKHHNKYPILPPSIEIDEIWHHHILDTYKYQEDCQNIFGQFMHHYPYFGMRGEEDKQNLLDTFQITQRLHFQEFGEYIPAFEECEEEELVEVLL